MSMATFDTLKFANALKAAGVSDRQAEAEAVVLAEVFSINFREVATKEDLKRAVADVETKLREVEQRLNAKIDLLRSEVYAKIDQAKAELNAKIDTNHTKLTGDMYLLRWMFGLLISLVLAIFVRLFFFQKTNV